MQRRSRLWLSTVMTAALVALQVPSFIVPAARTALAADGPDLVVTALSASSNTLVPGGRATYTWTIKNQGTTAATATATTWGDQLWLSTSATSIASAAGAGGIVAVRSLAPGEQYTRTFSATVPNVTAGSYFIVLQVDSANDIAETDETNNLFAIPVRVVAPVHIGRVAPAAPNPPPGNNCTTCTLFQGTTDAAAPSYAAPFDGVINTWFVQGPTDTCPGCQVKLRVFRQTSPGTFLTVAESAWQTVGTGLQTYTTKIEISAGDVIGIDATNGIRWYASGLSGDVINFVSGDPTPGTSFGVNGNIFWFNDPTVGAGNRVNVEAVVTPASQVQGIAECRFASNAGVSTVLLPSARVQLFSGSALLATTTANSANAQTPAAYTFSFTAPNATYTVRYTGFASFQGVLFDALALVSPPVITCDVTFTTDGSGNAIVPEPTPLLDRLNHLWFRPYHLTPNTPIEDVIPVPGMSTWYRVTVKPHQRLTFRLTNPPTQYTVLAFTDLFAVAKELLQEGQTLDQLRLLDSTQDRSAPDLDSPDLDSPDLDSPDLDSPDLDSPDLDSPDLDSPDLDSPDLDSPDLDSPDLDSPDLDSPDLDSNGNVVPASVEVATYGSVYVAAQRHALRAFSAQPGAVAQTIVMNTRDYQGDVYFRVRAHGDLSSSDTFTVTATTEGGAGCTPAPLVVRTPSLTVPAGTYKTLVLTNSAGSWFSGQTAVSKATFSAALASFASRGEVNGVVLDLADDANLQLSFADWVANPTCVAQANAVARSIKQLVDQARAHGIEYVVMVGPDPAVPFFRTRDDAELSKESRYSGGLDALTPLETAISEDYVLTDSF
jgi:hypothetical protein